MKRLVIILIVFVQLGFAQQDDGVVSFDLPIRNSLVFNRFAINPTFTFVRQQNRFINATSKRERTQFNNAPETLLASYSGRFSENIGAGVSAFQQNYGVLTTFGGVLNFAYNVKLEQDSNLTFGLNLGAYTSGINTGNVVTNFDDPSLQNVPSNTLVTVNPGINYGTKFLDFGISFNNIVLYNLGTSSMIEDDPRQAIKAHIMHTGYFDGRGFFDNTKFSGALMAEFRPEKTVISGLAMLDVPKGLWFQIGYNNLFGMSGGLGVNVTKNIALEFNIEKALGNQVEFGTSHEISLAYRIINKKKFKYNGDDEVSGLIFDTKKTIKPVKKASEEELAGIRERAKQRRLEREAKLLEEEKAKAEAETQAKLLAEQKAKEEAEARAKALAEQKANKEAEARAKALAEQKAKEEAEARAKALAEQKAKEEAEARAKALAEQKAKEEAEAQAKLLAEQKAKEEAEAQAKQLAEQKAKEEAEAQAKQLAEQKAKEEAEAQAKLLAEQKAKEEAEAQVKLLAEQKAKQEADAEKSKEELITKPKDEFGKAMLGLDTLVEASKKAQDKLLNEYTDIINVKDEDLKALKEENDLSEQGITVAPRPFKSVTAENNKLRSIKSDLEDVIKDQDDKIKELKALYEERTIIGDTLTNDTVLLFYKNKIKRLEAEQLQAVRTKAELESRLETIRVATEFEKRRRIVRAAYDNEEERYAQDRTTLENIKRNTKLASTPYEENDFDFGEDQGNNIKILKNISNEENGFYLVLAVHKDVTKRNDFVTKLVASGEQGVNFFYDVNTSKYYIYINKFNNLGEANAALNNKGTTPYNVKMSLVKIEN